MEAKVAYEKTISEREEKEERRRKAMKNAEKRESQVEGRR